MEGEPRRVRPGARNSRLGKKHSPETIEKLRVAARRKRGSARERWTAIYDLCLKKGYRLQRIRNYWLLFDENNAEHSFRTADAAIRYLKSDSPEGIKIATLCQDCGYLFNRIGTRLFEIFDIDGYKHITGGKRVFYGDADATVRFLEHMKRWMIFNHWLPGQ
jgi:hypothetical protein